MLDFKDLLGTSTAVHKLTLRAPQQEAWDQFLVGKLRSCTLHGVPKENNKQTNNLLDLPYPSILIHIKSTLTIFFQQMKISNKISFWWKIRKKEGVECLKSEEGGICEDIKWKVEKGRRLKCFILLLKSGPVCLHLGSAENHSAEGCFCLAKCLEAVLPGLIYEDEIGTYFFFPHCLFPWGFVNWGITSQESLSKTNILLCMFLISTRAIISQCELKGRPRSWARQIESSLFRTKWGRGWFL